MYPLEPMSPEQEQRILERAEALLRGDIIRFPHREVEDLGPLAR